MEYLQPMETFCKSLTGLRESNQDGCLIERCQLAGKKAVVLAVADGMGGMDGGEIASRLALDTVARYAREVFPALSDPGQELRSSVWSLFQQANRAIWDYGQAHNLQRGIGSTLVLAVLFEGRFLIANTGDSRCYYINDYEVRQITRDHSQVQDLVDQGSMTLEAAARSPYRNQLTDSLGEPKEVRVDLFPSGTVFGLIDEPCALVLSTDGWHGELTAEEIFTYFHSRRTSVEPCSALMALALQKGSTDNLTVAAAFSGDLRHHLKTASRLPSPEEILARLRSRYSEDTSGDVLIKRRSWRQRLPVFSVYIALLILTVLLGAYAYQQSYPPALWKAIQGYRASVEKKPIKRKEAMTTSSMVTTTITETTIGTVEDTTSLKLTTTTLQAKKPSDGTSQIESGNSAKATTTKKGEPRK